MHDQAVRGGWGGLTFFQEGAAARLAALLDQKAAGGVSILPQPAQIFQALRLTPRAAVRVVILGQDPYPTPGDAHGLAFSYSGQRRLPASLKNIFKELASDTGSALRERGDLSDWAKQGVLLLNTALSVEAGKAGAHLAWGWQVLTDEIMRDLAQQSGPLVPILWGDRARHYAALFAKHEVIESPHPSPLSAYRGFYGSRPFSRANALLSAQGAVPIAWG
ncbi:MAG: uracil-DNA glycosylase [Beijerinckiaceae bacterium]